MNKGTHESEAVKWAVKKYAAMMTDRQIAKGLNMAVGRITMARLRLGIKKLDKSRIRLFNDIVEKYSPLNSDGAIAKRMHVPRGRVKRARQRLGIKKSSPERTETGDIRREKKMLRDIYHKIEIEQALTEEEHNEFMRSKGYVV